MGGNVTNILEGVERGVDFFDCVYPSRNGRHGYAYTNEGKRKWFNARYETRRAGPLREDADARPACSIPEPISAIFLKQRNARHAPLCAAQSLFLQYNDDRNPGSAG